MQPIAIRGATTVTANTVEEIKKASVELVQAIVDQNQIQEENIIMVFLTMTDDLTAFNASSAIRLGMNWNLVPFFTSQEPSIEGMLPLCIRVLIQIHSSTPRDKVKHVYLGQAAHLRPDIKTAS
jgi:chorismate mutase